MTVQELISQLQDLPPNTKVVVRGYEGGYNDILNLKEIKIKTNPDAYWYDGKYELSNEANAIEAVDLFGENQNPKDVLKLAKSNC